MDIRASLEGIRSTYELTPAEEIACLQAMALANIAEQLKIINRNKEKHSDRLPYSLTT